jgi:hypothetical protein
MDVARKCSHRRCRNTYGAATTAAPILAAIVVTLGVAWWLVYALANGASSYGDSPSYLAFADALEHGRLPTSERTPGYPIVLVACRSIAAIAHVATDVVLVVVQTLLLTGVCTCLLYGLARRLTGSATVALVTACLFVADSDVHSFGAAIMSEAVATTLAVAMIWLAIRDGGWQRAGWVSAALVLTRPAYLFVPAVFAGVELWRTRRFASTLAPLVPTLALVLLCAVGSMLAGARASTPVDTFAPLHAFARIYEFGLWKVLPEGPERRLIADERAARRDVYAAASRLRAERGAASVSDVVGRVVRAAPLEFLGTAARTLPQAFHQPSLWKPTHRQPRVFAVVVRWHGWYRAALYRASSRFRVFLLLSLVATVNGFGWPRAARAFQTVITPFVVERFVSTALLAMGTDQVGRLAMAFRPFYCLVIALAVVRLARAARTVRAWLATRSPMPDAAAVRRRPAEA